MFVGTTLLAKHLGFGTTTGFPLTSGGEVSVGPFTGLIADGPTQDACKASTTPVTLTYTAPEGNLAIAQPPNITIDATGPSGAAVSYPAPTVTDPDDATAPAAVCNPASGTVFPIGTTTVNCSAADSDDTDSPVATSFTVTVNGAAAQLGALEQSVQGTGPGTSLAGKITAVQSYLASGHIADACSTLSGFIHEVRAQSGKKIPAGQAAQLIADAQRVQAVLAC